MPLPPRRISVIDLGFENAQRLNELAAKHPRKRFLGVEFNKQKGLQTRRHNLKLIWGDAFGTLRRLPPESANVVTADYLFADEFRVKGLPAMCAHAKNRLPFKVADALERIEVSARNATIAQVHRVLGRGGRFFINDYNMNIGKLEAMLERAGFTVTSRPTPEVDRTRFQKLIREGLAKGIVPPASRKDFAPWQIIAVKRKPKNPTTTR